MPSSSGRPNTRTDSRPTALATRSQYRSSVARSGARISCGTSISMPSTMARKSSRLQVESSNRRDIVPQAAPADGPDTARRYRRAIAEARPAARAAGRRNRRCRRPAGRSCRSETSPRAARAAESASPRRTNCRTRSSRQLALAAARPRTRHAPAAGFGHGPPPRSRGARSRRPRRRGCGRAVRSGRDARVSLRGSRTFSRPNDLVGEGLDHGDLEPEPEILDLGAERFAFVEQRLGPHRQRMQALQQAAPTPAPPRVASTEAPAAASASRGR